MKVTARKQTGVIKVIFEDVSQFTVDTNVKTGLIYEIIGENPTGTLLIQAGTLDPKKVKKGIMSGRFIVGD